MKITTKNGTVNIDGKTFNGSSISISGNKVTVDGIEQSGELIGHVTVIVQGDAELIEMSSGSVKVEGKAGWIKTQSGSVSCGDVTGDVETLSGNITCQTVSGSAKTMSGDIRGLKL